MTLPANSVHCKVGLVKGTYFYGIVKYKPKQLKWLLKASAIQ